MPFYMGGGRDDKNTFQSKKCENIQEWEQYYFSFSWNPKNEFLTDALQNQAHITH
jgi:hypothetical protein